MATAYKTPGVYVEEIPKFPPSIAPVETAIPAFIGYTEKAIRNGESLVNKPVRIESLAEYRQLFGEGPAPDVQIYLDTQNNFVKGEAETQFYLYDSLRLFYENGGGNCYIVSVGDYSNGVASDELENAIEILEQEDEPTIILAPDAVSATNGPYAFQIKALAQCNKLMDRVTLCDLRALQEEEKFEKTVADFRDKIGINFLKYGAAYAPWVNGNLPRQIWHKNLKLKRYGTNQDIQSESLTTDADLLKLIRDVKLAEGGSETLKIKITSIASLNDTLQKALNDYRLLSAGSTAADLTSALQKFTDLMIDSLQVAQELGHPVLPYPNDTEYRIADTIASYLRGNPSLKNSVLELAVHHKLQSADAAAKTAADNAKATTAAAKTTAETKKANVNTAATAVPAFAAAATMLATAIAATKTAADVAVIAATAAANADPATVALAEAAKNAAEAAQQAAETAATLADDAKTAADAVLAVVPASGPAATSAKTTADAAKSAADTAASAANDAKTAADDAAADPGDAAKATEAKTAAADAKTAIDAAANAAGVAKVAADALAATIPTPAGLAATVATAAAEAATATMAAAVAAAYADAVTNVVAVDLQINDIIETGTAFDAAAALLGFADGTALLANPTIEAITAAAAHYTDSVDTLKERADIARDAAYAAALNAISLLSAIQASTQEFEKKFNDTLLATFGKFKDLVIKGAEALNLLPPSGAIAGVYAAVDRDRGVWKAPANVSLNAVISPAVKISHEQQESYNVDVNAGKSINIIRAFTGKGTLVWGARTLAGNDNEWRYVNVRRFFNFVEESVKKATEQFVFEPNDANTWVKVQAMIENFLTTLWRQGALQGIKPEHAFYVAVGLGKTMTPLDILEGRMIVEIGMAAVRPAEFIILRFSHKMAES